MFFVLSLCTYYDTYLLSYDRFKTTSVYFNTIFLTYTMHSIVALPRPARCDIVYTYAVHLLYTLCMSRCFCVCAALSYFEISLSIFDVHTLKAPTTSCSLACCYYSFFNYNKHFWLSFLFSLHPHQ